PPTTQHFFIAPKSATVLLVSRTAQRSSPIAAIHADVAVATPDSWLSRLSILRSAVSIVRNGPEARNTTADGVTRLPSDTTGSISTSLPCCSAAARSNAAATGIPAIVPACLETTSATPYCPSRIVASVVTSGPQRRSSASVPR